MRRLRAKQSKIGEAVALCTESGGGGRTRRTKDQNGKLKEGIGSTERFIPIGCTRAMRRDRNTRQRRGPTWEPSGSTEMDETRHNHPRRSGGEVRLLTLRGLTESFYLGDARGDENSRRQVHPRKKTRRRRAENGLRLGDHVAGEAEDTGVGSCRAAAP